MVSGSQDCTMKLWSLKGVFKEAPKSEIVKLKVKYTQLAHDKVGVAPIGPSPSKNMSCVGHQFTGHFSQ